MAECCNGGTTLLYPCSGASDVGEVTDRVARKLWSEGFATKTCLAAIGAEIPGFIASAKGADINITIDGCPLACARKSLERVGVTPQSHILTDMGLEKGKTSVSVEVIDKICKAVKANSGMASREQAGDGCGCAC